MLTTLMDLIDNPEEKRKFEQLFTSYQQTMYHIAYRILKNQHDAEDAVQ